MAIFASLIHFLPFSASIVLIVITRRGFYIGGELAGAVGRDRYKFLGLQVAAKLHELTMHASLSHIVFAIIRHQIFSGRAVPFAALTSALDFNRISYLWSKEFLAVCTTHTGSLVRKIYLILVLLVCCILGVAVAPASAIAMQPVLDWWPAGGTDIWLNATREQLFPTELNETHTLGTECDIASQNDHCPSASWNSIENLLAFMPLLNTSRPPMDARLPDIFTVRARTAGIEIYIELRQPVFDRYTFNYTIATTQHAVMAEALAENTRLWDLAARYATERGENRFFYRREADYTMNSSNPIVHVRCAQAMNLTNTTSVEPQFPNFAADGYPAVPVSDSSWQAWIGRILTEAEEPGLLWVNLPSHRIGRASLGAIVVLPGYPSKPDGEVWGCSADARWARALISAHGIRRFTRGRHGGSSGGIDPKHSWMGQDGFERIMVRPGFAQRLNPTIEPLNSTVFAQLSGSAGIWNRQRKEGEGYAPAIEAILSLMIVNGMARVGYNVTIQGDLADWHNGIGPWWRAFMPSAGKIFGVGGNAYNVSKDEQERFYKTRMDVFAQGYAYVYRGQALKLSVTILVIYAAIASTHTLYTVFTFSASSSWNSPSELVALALTSDPPPDSFNNTAAGISHISTLRQDFRIEASQDHLRLSPGSERLPPNSRVQPNKPYG